MSVLSFGSSLLLYNNSAVNISEVNTLKVLARNMISVLYLVYGVDVIRVSSCIFKSVIQAMLVFFSNVVI